MPVEKVGSGYRWGKTGKVYATKRAAEMQGAAIEAGKSKGTVRWPAKKGK
jgi:hypothetical protein